MRKTFFLLIFCCALGTVVTDLPLRAQEAPTYVLGEQRSIADSTWQRLTAPPKFSYRNKVEGAIAPKPRTPSFLERLVMGIIAFFATALGYIVMGAVLLGIVIYVVYRLFGKDGRFAFSKAKKLAEDGGQPAEEDLQGTAWMRLLEEAYAAGNLRAAVRYGYLYLLQMLEERGHIHYLPAKTNGDYAAELAGTAAALPFRAVTRRYEFVWYGDYPITREQFAAYKGELTGLQNTLGKE